MEKTITWTKFNDRIPNENELKYRWFCVKLSDRIPVIGVILNEDNHYVFEYYEMGIKNRIHFDLHNLGRMVAWVLVKELYDE